MSEAGHPARLALDDWRAAQDQGREVAAHRSDAWIGGWASLTLVATVLYVLIGHSPYDHELVFDSLTEGAILSPVNRYIWLGLLALAAPILIVRFEALRPFAERLWPLLLLFVWFAASTRWALDPAASQRRFFLYVVGLIICVAIRAGLPDGRRIHAALAWACAIVIAIDLGSWIVAPAASMTELGLAAIHTHKNTLGLVMLFSAIVIAPYALWRPTRNGKLAWGSVFLAGVVLLIASRSKTSIALFVVAGLLGPLLWALTGLRARLLWGLVAAAATALAAAGFGWLAWCALAGADPLGPIKQLTFTNRTDVWRFVLGEFARKPLSGVGFGSFWDIDPAVQPSKQTDLWFAKPDAPTNEAHNGYLDLLVTTGLPGLAGALILLFRWIWGGLGLIRVARLAQTARGRATAPYALFLGVFPLMFFIHNWMESSYFTADAAFGLIILLVGVDIELRERRSTAPAPSSAHRGTSQAIRA
jgi:O-antigen ligase